MTLEDARKWLAMNHRIRRKRWKKHIQCTAIYEFEGHEYMKLWGFPKNQRLTEDQAKATDWEKC